MAYTPDYCRCFRNCPTNVSAADLTWSPTLTSQACKFYPIFPPRRVPHCVSYPFSNWQHIARFAVPVPEEWLPGEAPSFVSFDDVGSIFPGEPYDNGGLMDPYPEFCWISKRIRKGIVDVKAVDVDAEPFRHVVGEKADDVQTKRRPRFFKRLMMKLKTFARRPKRRTPVSYQDSFYTLPPTPDISSFASSYSYTHP